MSHPQNFPLLSPALKTEKMNKFSPFFSASYNEEKVKICEGHMEVMSLGKLLLSCANSVHANVVHANSQQIFSLVIQLLPAL